MTTDYRAAACLHHDPDMWTDAGTPQAHAICAACPIRSGCLTDALTQPTRGVMRAGQAFPEQNGQPARRPNPVPRHTQAHIERWVLRQQGLSYPAIGALVGRDFSTVAGSVRKVTGTPALLREARRQAGVA